MLEYRTSAHAVFDIKYHFVWIDGKNGLCQWRITEGLYRVALGRSAADLLLAAEAPLTARVFGK
jgi:hypothetical protein